MQITKVPAWALVVDEIWQQEGGRESASPILVVQKIYQLSQMARLPLPLVLWEVYRDDLYEGNFRDWVSSALTEEASETYVSNLAAFATIVAPKLERAGVSVYDALDNMGWSKTQDVTPAIRQAETLDEVIEIYNLARTNTRQMLDAALKRSGYRKEREKPELSAGIYSTENRAVLVMVANTPDGIRKLESVAAREGAALLDGAKEVEKLIG